MANPTRRSKGAPFGPLFGPKRDRTAEQLAGPIRGELFGAERLAAHARDLGAAQIVITKDKRRGPGPLLGRLEETTDSRGAREGCPPPRPGGSSQRFGSVDNFISKTTSVTSSRISPAILRELTKMGMSATGYPRVTNPIELSRIRRRITQENSSLRREFQHNADEHVGLWAIRRAATRLIEKAPHGRRGCSAREGNSRRWAGGTKAPASGQNLGHARHVRAGASAATPRSLTLPATVRKYSTTSAVLGFEGGSPDGLCSDAGARDNHG